jgi:hypothetical protein
MAGGGWRASLGTRISVHRAEQVDWSKCPPLGDEAEAGAPGAAPAGLGCLFTVLRGIGVGLYLFCVDWGVSRPLATCLGVATATSRPRAEVGAMCVAGAGMAAPTSGTA